MHRRLTNFVSRHDIADLLRHRDPEEVVGELVALVLAAGGPDNLTRVLLDVT